MDALSSFVGLARSPAVRGPAAFPHRLMVLTHTVATAARFFPTTVNLVDCGPATTLGFVLGHAATLVPFFYVLSLPLLFFRVFGFVSAWHHSLLWILRDGADGVPSAHRIASA